MATDYAFCEELAKRKVYVSLQLDALSNPALRVLRGPGDQRAAKDRALANLEKAGVRTTIVSTVRGDREIAIGNLIGSSVYNLTLILGVPVLVAHGSGPIDTYLLHIDLPIMVAVCLLCVPLFLTGRRLSRAEGVLMVAGYVVYLGYLLVART